MLCTVWWTVAVAVLMVSYYFAVDKRREKGKNRMDGAQNNANKNTIMRESMQNGG